MQQRVAKIYYKGEQKPAILFQKKRKHVLAAVQTARGIKTVKIKHKEAEEAPDVMYKDQPYPVERAKKAFAKIIDRGATNKDVRTLLGVKK